MIPRLVTICLVAMLLVSARATDARPNAEAEGRELAQKVLMQSPAENTSINGTMRIRQPKKKTVEIPVKCQIVVTATNWQTIYRTLPGTNSTGEFFIVTRDGTNQNRYELNGTVVADDLASVPFAGSDFLLTDFGLEFLHWPTQRVLKKDIRRSRFCVFLESVRGTNAPVQPDGYARVISWIDDKTGGILHAESYDDSGRKLKEFEPKEFEKVDGQYQLREMQMINLQTGSRSTLEFDLTLSEPPDR
jgi:hypothetical protein